MNGVKLMLFFAWTLVHQGLMIIKEDIQVLGEDPAGRLDVTTTTVEVTYFINISKPREKTCLSLYYNAGNSFSGC